MGIRPRKSIGWGVQVKGSQLSESVVNNLRHNKSLSFAGLIDYVVEKDLLKVERKYREIDKERFSHLDRDGKICKYVDVISGEYDDERDFDDIDFTVMFYPDIISPLTIHQNPVDGRDYVDECKEGDGAFVYAEIEHFFPESMDTLKTVSYNFKIPPFPSDYSIIEKNDFKDVSDFIRLTDAYMIQDVKKCLLKIDTKFLDIFAGSAGFDSVEDVEKYCHLAPPEDVFVFAQYSQIFKTAEHPFYLRPTVVYSWT